MSGRFTLHTPVETVVEQFGLARDASRSPLLAPRYNIAPTQTIAAIRQDAPGGLRRLVGLRWGLVPAWSADPHGHPPLINARAETVAQKPSFREALACRRCLVPADGFYEWQLSPESGAKQPFYIRRRDRRPFAFAGLWERWQSNPSTTCTVDDNGAHDLSPEGRARISSASLESCAYITTDANELLRPLHDRMPVILRPQDFAAWLDPALHNSDAACQLLAQGDYSELVIEPVSTRVNHVAHDDPACIRVLPVLGE